MTPVTDDITGQIMNGYIRLRGYLVTMGLRVGRDSKLEVIVNRNYLSAVSGCMVSADVFPENLMGKFYFLPIHSYQYMGDPWVQGLILQKTGQVEGQYERFGGMIASGKVHQIFNASIHDDQLFGGLNEDSTQQVITLV